MFTGFTTEVPDLLIHWWEHRFPQKPLLHPTGMPEVPIGDRQLGLPPMAMRRGHPAFSRDSCAQSQEAQF